ncbi:MAG: vitamin B12-dependent ribonucleotide reductase [Nanoarchaeota archaeon]
MELEIIADKEGKYKVNGKLNLKRYFSLDDVSPYDRVKWTTSDVDIKDENGKVLFIQKNSKFPEYFSPVARSVVSSRYSYGEIGTSERETSLKSIDERISETYGRQSLERGYFSENDAKIFIDELAELTLHQKFAFNSPVWFNVGTDRYESRRNSQKSDGYHIENGVAVLNKIGDSHLYPQTSACFIQFVDDTMEDIMALATKEAMLFKYGSGTGTDLSTLRSYREKLSGGGKPSGPLAYLTFYDKVAQIVKSGGKTRRAAKMDSLKVWHPDIKEFIIAKMNEEKKAKALVKQGYSPTDSSETVAYQNVNLSVRVSDEFMRAVENDEEWQTKPVHSHDIADKMPRYKARELMRLIAEGAWECGCPGLQYETTINKWHTAKKTGSINASNPCSEYMYLDNTSCNLASYNLRRFQNKDGSLNIKDLEQAIHVFTIAMDLNYEFSSFPSQSIAQNSFDNRTLGLGYANLGALLMSEGIPYDSDEARAIAASITAFTTAKVYETSTIMAEKLGTFKNYEKNREPMLEVIRMHKDSLKGIDLEKLPEKFRPVYDKARELWNNVVERGEQYGFRNAQATVLAPTGTIAFMMDCDTTGIEPDIALVKYKNLAEGGLLKIVNQTIPNALEKLEYDEEERGEITRYIYEKETIEGAPHLKEKHLPVFDCAFKPVNGKRSISWEGHVKMMAATQPFISGAISKTVNMPAESTIKDIQGAYELGWKLGLKALAIYRDGSKAWQPLEAGKKSLEEKLSPEPSERIKLPHTRNSITHKFTIDRHDVYVHVGHYEDGKPGELFLTMAKEGSTLSGIMNALGTSISIGLQYGVPLEVYVKKFVGSNFEPSGWVEEGDKENIHQAKSMLDYLARWLGKRYIADFGNNNDKKEQDDKSKDKSKLSELTLPKIIKDNNIELSPKGPKVSVFCTSCGNSNSTYKIGECQILCDINFGGCGFLDPKGCSD